MAVFEIKTASPSGEVISRGSTHVVAVTGGSGLIGRRLLPLLEQSALELRVLTRDGTAVIASSKKVRGDLLHTAALRELVRGADTVLHLAGMAHTSLSGAGEKEHAFAVNVGGTRALLQASLAAGVSRFLFVSSAHVYAGQRGIALDENSPTSGDSPYAEMKLLAEQAAFAAAAQGMSVSVLRPCLVYGPGVRHNLQTLLRALRRGYYLQPAGGRTVRSLASVDTVAGALLHLLGRLDCTGCYNVADREPVRLEEWVDALAEKMGVRHPIVLPSSLIKMVAEAGSAAASMGLRAPFTRTTYEKLTAPFSLDVQKLASTGFTWPATGQAILQQMIDAEFAKE